MDRRDFIKRSIGVATGLAIAPSVALSKEEEVPTERQPSEYFMPTKTNIDKLKQAIGWAESKKFKIKKILCTPEFQKGLDNEWNILVEQDNNIDYHYDFTDFNWGSMYIYGYKVNVSESLLGDFVLDCLDDHKILVIFRG